jgi:hypothetical protein
MKKGQLLDIAEHHDQEKYPRQMILIVNINDT